MIRKEIVIILGFKGRDISVIITKVGGEEEIIKIKVYKVFVLLLDSIMMFLIKAIGISCISEEVLVV